jgi:Tfp pilus assembly protein PilF
MMQVQDLVRKGQWAAARQALQNLASRVPSSTQYKALLAYARGREAQQLGRNDEATLEFQRALQLDPNLSLAKSALAEMQSRHK